VKVESLVNWFGWIGLIVATCTACTHLDDLTNVPPYSQHINEKYVLNSDCYAVQFGGESEQLITCGVLEPMFPNPADASLVGKYIGHRRILGILPKGSTFRIFKLERQRTFESSYYVYLVALEDPAKQLWPSLSALLITDETKTPPVIDPKVASRIEPY
jgi:hypothetical protein